MASQLRTLAVKRLKPDKTRIKYMTKEQVRQRLSKAKESGMDIYAYIAIAVYTGFRNSSIVAMRWKDVEPLAVRISAPAKGSEVITVPLRPALAEILEEYGGDELQRLQSDKRDEWLFPSPVGDGHVINYYHRLQRVAKAANLEWVTAHVVRHTFGSILAQAGVSIRTIADHMGHSDVRVTRDHYAALLPSNLDDAMNHLEL